MSNETNELRAAAERLNRHCDFVEQQYAAEDHDDPDMLNHNADIRALVNHLPSLLDAVEQRDAAVERVTALEADVARLSTIDNQLKSRAFQDRDAALESLAAMTTRAESAERELAELRASLEPVGEPDKYRDDCESCGAKEVPCECCDECDRVLCGLCMPNEFVCERCSAESEV